MTSEEPRYLDPDSPVDHLLVNVKTHLYFRTSCIRPSTAAAINSMTMFKRMNLRWFRPQDVPFCLLTMSDIAAKARTCLPESDR